MAAQPPPEPAPPPRAAPQPRGELGKRLERVVLEQRPPVFEGKGKIVALIFALALGGMIVQWTMGEAASPLAKAVRERAEQDASGTSQPLAAPPAAAARVPEAPGSRNARGSSAAEPRPLEATPAAQGAASEPAAGTAPSAPPAAPAAEGTIVASALQLALAAQRAPLADRPALRQVALHAFAEMAGTPGRRRAALEAALRLAGDAMPEESEQWTRLRDAALEALASTADAALGITFLAARFDRGGDAGQAALERIVDDERAPLELRVQAARSLTAARRTKMAARVGSRREAHPLLLGALR